MAHTDSPLHKSDRQVQMEKARRYYDGYPDPKLRNRARIDDNLPLPLARIVVDKGAAFLFGKDVQSQILDSDSDGPQEWLNEAWRRNKRGIFLQKLATNGGICGHAFVRILDTKPYPRLINLDPQMVEVATKPDDCDEVYSYTIAPPARTADSASQSLTYTRTLIENQSATAGYASDEAEPEWTIADQEYRGGDAKGEDGAWVTVKESAWPYPFSPVIGCQNLPRPNDYWGESDVPQDILSLMDGINRTTSNFNKIVRLFAHPKVWTRGLGSQRLDLSTDSIINLPHETAEMKVLETPADLPSLKEFLEKLLSLHSYAVRIPLIAMGQPDGAGSPSGVALQIRFQPLLEKTESKRLTYGDLLTELDRCMLQMGGFGDSLLTQIVWPELLPKDPMQEREAMILEDQLGITSKHTFTEQLGMDYDQEQKYRQEEAQEAVDGMSYPVLPGQRVDGTVPDHPSTAQGQQMLSQAMAGLTPGVQPQQTPNGQQSAIKPAPAR